MSVIKIGVSLIIITALTIGASYIRLAFDPDFKGERAQSLLGTGIIIILLGIVAGKEFWGTPFDETK